MVKCSAPKCDNSTYKTSSGITFHRFPKDDRLKNAWMANITKEGWQPTRSSVLCSTHFEPHLLDHSGFRSKLIHGAIPTIFDLQKENKPTSVANNPAQGSGSRHHTALQDMQNLQSHSAVISHDSPQKKKAKPATLPDLVNKNASGDQVLRDEHNIQPSTSTATSHSEDNQAQLQTTEIVKELTKRNMLKSKKIKAFKATEQTTKK